MCARVCAHQYVMWFSHIYPHLFCSPPVNSFPTYFFRSLSFCRSFLLPSLPPLPSLFLSDQVGFIRWFSVQATGASSGWHHWGGQHFPLSQSLSMIREKWGPESPSSPGTVICFIALGKGHCRMVTEPILHSYNADTLKFCGNKCAAGMLCSEGSAPPTAHLHDMGIFSFIFL